MLTYTIVGQMNTLISLLSITLLPLKLGAFFIRLAQTLIRAVFGGMILGCLAPLGLLTLLLLSALALLVF